MARNSSGTYSLPAGNPVVTGTSISSTWANSTLDDIATALTDSLSRSGDGGMLAPLELTSGAVGAPSLTFGAETTSGLYRAAAGEIGFAIGGAKIMGLTATGLDITGDLDVSGSLVAGSLTLDSLAVDPGTAALPGYTFVGDLNTGMSAEVADTLILSTAGVARGTFSAATIALAATNIGLTGAVAITGAATISTTLGVTGASTLAAVSATTGTFSSTLGVTGVATFGAALRAVVGDASTPPYSFTDDPNTGLYRPSADELGFTLGGTGYLVGYRNVPINEQNGNYTALLTDSGKCLYKASGGAGETYTIPANASVAYPLGTVLTFVNQGGDILTIAITSDTLTLAGAGTTGSVELADNGIASAIKVAATEWVISGTGLAAA